jgi:hypothetical protein
MFIDIHREIEKILYPFDPIGLYALILYVILPFILIILHLFT